MHVAVTTLESTAVGVLHAESELPKQRIKQAMSKGAVWLTRGNNTQRLRRAKRELKIGDELHLYYDADILAEIPAKPALIADVCDYSVWNKPYGLRSQGSKWGDHCTLVRWAEQHLQPERNAYTVHRLDRAASGLMLVAHSKRTAAALSKMFRERSVRKRYHALVAGDFSTHENPVRVNNTLDGKEAVSEMSLLEVRSDGEYSLLDVAIETGRKHQIRRHLADLGHPVIGDRLYGSATEDSVDLQLTAYLLGFVCPQSGDDVEYRLPLAQQFESN